MYLLYELLHGCALGLAVPYLLYRSVREPGYLESLKRRFGLGAPAAEPRRSIWVHAVSVGEVIAATVLLARLRAAFPGRRLVVSVTTVTGRRVAREKLGEAADEVFYCPFDVRWIVRRFVSRLAPEALVVVETEIWPNLFREARLSGASTLLVNGRISDKSFPRYRRVRLFLRRYLREIDRILVQNELYRDRVVALGAAPERVVVAGSLKFDAAPPEPRGSAERILPGARTVLIAGSTLDPEERTLLDVFSRLRESRPDLLLVLAPRHPHRFGEAYELARSRGVPVARRSEGSGALGSADVVVLDTLGELAALYAEADLVFVGGSLAAWGGHNIIEPALAGAPVLFGPHMQNFPDVARLFLDAGGALQVGSADELELRLAELLASPERRRELAEKARGVIEANRGASDRAVAVLRELRDG